MNWNPATRRHFLQGTGKAALILPFLPSLLSDKDAQAQAAVKQKTFIGVGMQHGIAKMYSASDGAPSIYMPMFKNMQSFQPPGRHVVHYKTLDAARTDGGGQLSDIFDAAFNPYLSKMTMLQGLDHLPYMWAHHGAYFGNPHTALTAGAPPLRPAHATIDQVMAYSTNFYKNPALVGKSASWTGSYNEFNAPISHTFADPTNKLTCAIDGVNAADSPGWLWDIFFKNFTGNMTPAPVPAGPTLRQKMADRVLLDYKALVANPRLGQGDRVRLDRHIALLNDTQKSVNVINQQMALASCDTAPAKPADFGSTRTLGYTMRKQMLAASNNVIASAIACGLCHSFTSHFFCLLSDDINAWHAWAHAGAPEHKQQTSAILHDVVLDLVTKLDQNGLLDDSLVVVPQEHSLVGHQSWNTNMVMFGSAGGALKTGQYVDYRNMTGGGDDITHTRWGFPINQAWANILTAVGVPATEFEALNRDSNAYFSPRSGYGSSVFAAESDSPQASVFAGFKGRSLSEPLPLINV